MFFKMRDNVGPHEQDGKVYKSGDIIETDRPLDEMFPLKFDELPDPEWDKRKETRRKPAIATPKTKKRDKVDAETEDVTPSKESASTSSEYGEDVSDQFEGAAKAELQVFVKHNWYTVVDPEDGTVLTETRIRKNQVPAFLDKYGLEEVD